MAPVSPGRTLVRTLPLVAVISLVFGGFLWLQGDPRAAVVATLVTGVAMGFVFGQAPARLAWRLQEFANQVPGDPDATVAWHGEQTLEWPNRELTVEGNIHRYRLQDFAVHVGSSTRYLSATRPREAARTALEELGEDPALDDPSDRLPSLYPRLAGLKIGFLASVLAAIAVGLGGPVVAGGVYPLYWWVLIPAAGVLAGLGRWLGLAHTQQAFRSLAEELRYGGVEVGTIDRIGGWIRLEFVVHTSRGSVPVGCLAVPFGPITADHPTDPDDSVSTRLPNSTPIADRVARWRL